MGDDQGPTIRHENPRQGCARQRRVALRAFVRALRALDGAVLAAPAGAEVRMLAPGGAS